MTAVRADLILNALPTSSMRPQMPRSSKQNLTIRCRQQNLCDIGNGRLPVVGTGVGAGWETAVAGWRDLMGR